MVLFLGLRISNFFLLTLFSSLIFFPSLQAQEQITNIAGEDCCYDVDRLVKLEGQTYAIAKDHVKSVQIFIIENDAYTMIYSNHLTDKYNLMDQGCFKGSYYFLYTDRLEIFDLASQQSEEYVFSTPIDASRWNRHDPSIMTEYGVALIPKSDQWLMKFFDLSREKFQVLSMPNINRYTFMYALDSFLITFSSNGSNNATTVYSQNILTGRDYELFTVQSPLPTIRKVYNFITVIGEEAAYLTDGSPVQSRHLFDLTNERYWVHSMEDGGQITFMDQSKYSEIRKRTYDLESRLVDESVYTKHDQFFYEYRPLGNGRYMARGIDSLYTLDFKNDNLHSIDEYHDHYWTDSLYTFFQLNDSLISYDHRTKQKIKIGELGEIRSPLYFVRDSGSRYHAIFNKEKSNSGAYVIDANKGTIKEVLHLSKYQQGLKYLNTSLFSVGNTLLLGRDDIPVPTHIFDNDAFHEIDAFQPISSFLQYNGRHFLMGSPGNLYEWQGEDRFTTAISDIDIESFGYLVEKHSQLFFYKENSNPSEKSLVRLHPEEQRFDELMPGPDYDVYDVLFPDHPDYFIVHSPAREEVWSYDIDQGEWVRILSSQNYDVISEWEAFIIEDALIWMRLDKEGNNFLMRLDLQTGEATTVHAFDDLYDRRHARKLGQCGKRAFFYYRDYSNDRVSLWSTDGTSGGTSLLDTVITDRILAPVHLLKDTLFLNIPDRDNRLFTFDCTTSEFNEAEWTAPFVVQDQYKVGERTIVLGVDQQASDSIYIAEREGNSVRNIASSTMIKWHFNHAHLKDTLLAVSGRFDSTGENIWYVNAKGDFQRPIQFGQRDVPHNFKDFVLHEGDLYFLAYQYGPGRQVWRIPFDGNQTSTMEKYAGLTALQISPNPATAQIIVNHLSDNKASLIVYDNRGAVVKQIIKPVGVKQVAVDIISLPQGVYYMRSQSLGMPDDIRSGIFIKQ